ncbi:MAG: glycine zipper 2TM domain-containing protein [Lysobacteraceae bacterium]
MPRIAATILASALIAATGLASAQTRAPAPVQDRYSAEGPYYDYARVLRVDPVIQQTAPTRVSSGRCYTEGSQYAANDGYYDDRDGYGYDGQDGNGRDRGYDDGYGERRYGTETGRNVATVIGGIVGAALGSKVGGGSARYATAAVGSMVGGMAGRGVYEQAQRNKQPPRRAVVSVCDPVDARDDGRYAPTSVTMYDVTYEYAGRQYVTRTDHHPGDRMRVRVDVRPE